jgi:hypothetical protein
MNFLSLWDKLSLLLAGSKSEYQSNPVSGVSEQNRLIHRLNSIQLNDQEAKDLQGYLTTLLDVRYQTESSDLIATEQSDCVVLEMNQEELQEFSKVVGEHGLRTFRAIVQSDSTQPQARTLTIIGEHGLRLFHVHVQSRDSLVPSECR